MILCNKAHLSTAARGPCTAVLYVSLWFSHQRSHKDLGWVWINSIAQVYFGETDSPYRLWLTEKVVDTRARRRMCAIVRSARSAHNQTALNSWAGPVPCQTHTQYTPLSAQPCTCLQWSTCYHRDLSNHTNIGGRTDPLGLFQFAP